MPKLRRALGLFETTMYGIGIILGAGIYVLIGKAAGIAGNAVWAAFGIGAVVAAFTGLSFAELAGMFPRSAAVYLYAREAFGRRLPSFLTGWMAIYVLIAAGATVALGFGGYWAALLGGNAVLAAAGLIVALSLLNFYGIKESATFNILFTLIEVAGLLLIIGLAVPHFGSVNYFEAPAGIVGLLGAAVLVFFAYLGFEDIANITEEVRNPRRNVPRALLLALGISTILYMAVAVAVVSLLPVEQLAASAAPLAAAAEAAWQGAHTPLAAIALFATANTVLFLLVAASRLMYGMSREGELHATLHIIHTERRTPWVAVAAAGLLALGFLALGEIRIIAELTDFGAFLVFAVVNLAVIALRYSKPDVPRSFRVPLSIGRFPVLPALGALTSGAMLLNFRSEVVLGTIGVLGVGTVFCLLTRNRNHDF